MEKNEVSKINSDGELSDSLTLDFFPSQVIEKNPDIRQLTRSENRFMFNYLRELGLTDGPHLIVLSPSNYFYDKEELRDVKILVNLKQLNFIKELRQFLRTINQLLPERSHLIGSFIDRKNHYSALSANNTPSGSVDPVENGITSRIPVLNMIYDLLDSRTNRKLTKAAVSGIMKECGFKIVDMTDSGHLTCFSAQKIPFRK